MDRVDRGGGLKAVKLYKIKDLPVLLGISKQAVYRRISKADCQPFQHVVDNVRCITEDGVRFAFPTRPLFEEMDSAVFEARNESTGVNEGDSERVTGEDAEAPTALEKTMQYQLIAHQKEVDWLRSWIDKLTAEQEREREANRQEIEQLTATIREMSKASTPAEDVMQTYMRDAERTQLREQVRILQEELEAAKATAAAPAKKKGIWGLWG